MSFEFTTDQRRAIELRGRAALVSAGAGSGKTRVLTERLVRRVTDSADPKDIDTFLVITYTRAAAAELRERIISALGALAAADPTDRRLRRQQSLCYSAPIGTIHSFCASLLREGSHILGLPPSFGVADGDRAEAMRTRALEKVLDARYERIMDDEPFRLLVDTVGAGRDDSRLAQIVLSLHEKLRAQPYPERWAAERAAELESLNCAADETVWGRELLSAAHTDAEWCAETLERAAQEIAAGGEKLKKAYLAAFSEGAALMRDFCRRLDMGWDKAHEAVPLTLPALRALRSPEDPEQAARLKALRETCKGICEELSKTFASASASLMSDMCRTAPAMRALLELTLELDKAYSAEKRRADSLDYSDLEHLAIELLVRPDGSPTDFALGLRPRYTEIMVDEYQDVNAVQEAIFRAVSRDGENLFMVGDVKQSIYRFRLADPTIFLEKLRSTAPDAPEKILLRENFRSRRCVLDAANLVFGQIMTRELGELDYGEDAALLFGARDYPEGTDCPAEFNIFSPDGDDPFDDKLTAEARFTALKIKNMLALGAPVRENGAERACRPEDFAILLRSPGTTGAVFRRELERAGVPTGSGGAGGYFVSTEVSVTVDLLDIIDDPHSDVPLISVLRSPLFAFSPDELAEIRAAAPDEDFYGALTKCAAERGGRCQSFLETLNSLRAAAEQLGMSRLLWRVINETGLFAVCAAMPEAETRRENLMALFELAQRFESSGGRGVYRFVKWLRALSERGEEPSPHGTSGVEIMSIHKSKGLEFPFVFLCALGKQFNKLDLRDSVLLHPRLGMGPKVTDTARGVEYSSLSRMAISAVLKREMLSEEVRVLYVALTRARERLFMSCTWEKPQEALKKLRAAREAALSPVCLLRDSSPSDWLAAAALTDESVIALNVNPDAEDSGQPDSLAAAEQAARGSAELGQALDWRYPWAGSVSLPSKLTATELKNLRREDDDPEAERLLAPPPRPLRLPTADAAPRLTAAERGTATHTLLQYIDFAKVGSAEDVSAEILRLEAEGLLTPDEAAVVDAAAVARLFASPEGRRILAAEEVHREFRFTLLTPAAAYFASTSADDDILLQGIVDCWIVEKGQITVIDYKTDRIPASAVPERAREYAEQLAAYARALERITSLPVVSRLLCFLTPGVWTEI
ncbi:MAG: helicase-exonuclease AddAB subunit AddA [Oscillospiraceae bacterium]|nr:helicase-exonuclease AddAB subunit AddA [Oscillospiraceae bacterium]